MVPEHVIPWAQYGFTSEQRDRNRPTASLVCPSNPNKIYLGFITYTWLTYQPLNNSIISWIQPSTLLPSPMTGWIETWTSRLLIIWMILEAPLGSPPKIIISLTNSKHLEKSQESGTCRSGTIDVDSLCLYVYMFMCVYMCICIYVYINYILYCIILNYTILYYINYKHTFIVLVLEYYCMYKICMYFLQITIARTL